jgi:hydrogenase maturation protease
VGQATLVVGLGNPLRGDDGVGIRVVQALAEYDLPHNVEVLDGGTQGLGLVNLLEGQQRVIFVDAADVGQTPGNFVRFTLSEARLLGNETQLSVHTAGLREALLLAQALKMLPPEVIIFGMQPESLAWESGLSPPVEAGLANLISAIMVELSIEPE